MKTKGSMTEFLCLNCDHMTAFGAIPCVHCGAPDVITGTVLAEFVALGFHRNRLNIGFRLGEIELQVFSSLPDLPAIGVHKPDIRGMKTYEIVEVAEKEKWRRLFGELDAVLGDAG